MEKENKSMEVVEGAKEESGVCPCMKLVEISAQAVADELIYAISNSISVEFGERFIDMLRDEHITKAQTDIAVEMLFMMMKLVDSEYAISLMEDVELKDKERAAYFMDELIEQISLAVSGLKPYVY